MTTITIQATGHPPVTFEGVELAHEREMLEGDKRGVQLDLYRHDDGKIVAALTYLTTWGDERPVTRVIDGLNMGDVVERIRGMAMYMLPPGAGFPATQSYETRQAKLAGLMETLTLHALSQALAKVSQTRQDGAG